MSYFFHLVLDEEKIMKIVLGLHSFEVSRSCGIAKIPYLKSEVVLEEEGGLRIDLNR